MKREKLARCGRLGSVFFLCVPLGRLEMGRVVWPAVWGDHIGRVGFCARVFQEILGEGRESYSQVARIGQLCLVILISEKG